MKLMASNIAAIGLAVLVLVAGPTSSVYGQEPPIYGSQLMTEQERAEYRDRMRAATSEQEREQIRQEHHARMQERAEERGVMLPDQPPVTGMQRGAGPGGGQGRSTGAPDMRRQGSGAGRRGN
jgi:hypothetical protein